MARVISISADQSSISVDNTAPAANGSDVVNVFVTAKQDTTDDSGEALGVGGLAASNVVIAVTPSTGVTITQPTGATGQDGAIQGSFVSTNAATVTVSATVKGRAVTGGATVVVGGGAPSGSGLFYEQPTTVGNTRAASNGFTWSSTGARVSEQVVPAGKSGYGLRFRYGPDAVGADSSAEQPFNMGQSLDEVWIQYDLYVPSNFAHRNESPNNNKFLAMWRDTYSDVAGGTWRIFYEYTTNSGSTPNSNIRVMSSRWDFNSATDTGPNYTVTGQGSTFISAGTGLLTNAWNQVRVQLKASSAFNASDGIQRMWINGTLHSEITNGRFWNYDTGSGPGADCLLKQGYFMGWANSGFLAETDFYLYNAKFYNTDPSW